MQFGVIDYHIQQCENHLDVTGSRNTEIELYFVQYLLIRICAEFETRLSVLVERRCHRITDAHVKQFSGLSAKQACKRFNIGDIKGILARFGDDYKDTFDSLVCNTPAHAAWDNIYNNRVAVAHLTGTQMSFSDLKANYSNSLIVLDALVNTLGLNAHEIADLT